jgi:hypothetical protein
VPHCVVVCCCTLHLSLSSKFPLSMYIYIYICIYIHIHIYIYVHIYLYTHMCVCSYIHMHIHIHIYIHMCIYVICVYTHARTTHTYTHTNKSAVHATTFPQGIQHVTKPDNLFLLELHAKSYRHDQWHIPRQGRATPCVTWTTGVTWLILSSWCNRMTHRCDMTRMCAMVHSHDDRLHNGRQCQVNACVTWLVCLTFDMPIQPPSLISVISHPSYVWYHIYLCDMRCDRNHQPHIARQYSAWWPVFTYVYIRMCFCVYIRLNAIFMAS